MKHSSLTSPRARGFTLVEVLVVVGILGILMVATYPSLLNTMAVRNLENETREIQTFLQRTKLLAVDTKIVHRVHFYQVDGSFWAYDAERLQIDGTWTKVLGAPRKAISNRYNVTITFPADTLTGDPVAMFTPLGTFPQFAVNQNSITLQSPKLAANNQDDERVLSVFLGGSIHYAREKSI